MTVNIVVVNCGGPGFKYPEIPDKTGITFTQIDNRDNGESPCACYQQTLEQEWYGRYLTDEDIIIYAHDDLTIHDPDWLHRVLWQFIGTVRASIWDLKSNVVAVGLGGAVALGHPDLYRRPYNIMNLARRGYASNQTDAETHGSRFTGVKRVAVIEQFFMAIRTDWLRSIGGWPTQHLTHHCLDMWLACEAARDKKEIWMVGASCTHHGGGSSTSKAYAEAKWLQGGSLASDHQIPHRWIYEKYRDVLPLEVA